MSLVSHHGHLLHGWCYRFSVFGLLIHTLNGQCHCVADDLACYLVAAASLAVDAGVLTCHNLHVVGGDGDTGGAIVARKAAEIAAHALLVLYGLSFLKT